MPRVTAAMVAAGRPLGEPRLSADGSRVAFVSNGLVVVDAVGGPERVLSTDPAPAGARSLGGGVFDWSPDGEALVYTARGGGLFAHAEPLKYCQTPSPDSSVTAMPGFVFMSPSW